MVKTVHLSFTTFCGLYFRKESWVRTPPLSFFPLLLFFFWLLCFDYYIISRGPLSLTEASIDKVRTLLIGTYFCFRKERGVPPLSFNFFSCSLFGFHTLVLHLIKRIEYVTGIVGRLFLFFAWLFWPVHKHQFILIGLAWPVSLVLLLSSLSRSLSFPTTLSLFTLMLLSYSFPSLIPIYSFNSFNSV